MQTTLNSEEQMQYNDIHIIIMAGGIGSRFWPMSTPKYQKQFIDVMEKSKSIYTLPAEFGWSDLGSWGSLRTLLPQDEDGKAKVSKDRTSACMIARIAWYMQPMRAR